MSEFLRDSQVSSLTRIFHKGNFSSVEPLRIWIGYDSSESRAYTVCYKSIIRRSSIPVEIYALHQEWLRALGMYSRVRDSGTATEFAFSRFLLPALAGYQGSALFIDTDFLFLSDIAELFALYNPKYPIQCVHHENIPHETTKMGGVIQTQHFRKNWSSLFFTNAGHLLVKENLIPYNVNTQTAAWLHQFQWLKEEEIGELPIEWNALSGLGIKNPKAVHLTNGIRALHGNNTEYSNLWEAEEKA